MFRLIGLLVVLALGAAGMGEWDRHPPWGLHLHVFLWRPGFDLPASLATQRDQALAEAAMARANLDTCHWSEARLQAALDGQNQAVERLKAQSDAWTEQGRHDVQAARAVAESYRRQAEAILGLPAPPSGSLADRCAAADALILKEAAR